MAISISNNKDQGAHPRDSQALFLELPYNSEHRAAIVSEAAAPVGWEHR